MALVDALEFWYMALGFAPDTSTVGTNAIEESSRTNSLLSIVRRTTGAALKIRQQLVIQHD